MQDFFLNEFVLDSFNTNSTFFLSLLFSDSQGMMFGSGDIPVPQDKDYECKSFPFNPSFSGSDVRVQLALTSAEYDAAVTWVNGVSKTG